MKKYSFIIIFILLFCCSCSSNKSQLKEEASLTHLTIPISYENISLDPTLVSNGAEKNVVSQLYDGLTYINSSKNSASPLLANSYTHSEDYKIWTFELREGLKFSDGTDITPSEVVSSLKRTDLARRYKNLTIHNENYNILIKSDNPMIYLDELLAYPKYLITKEGTDFSDYKNIISSGSYKLKDYKDNTSELIRNDNYWDNINTKINSVTYEYQKDPELAYQMSTQDLYDIFSTSMYDIPKYKLRSMISDPNIVKFKGNNIAYLYLNPNSKILNENLRKSLIFSLERQSIVNTDLIGYETPLISLFEENSFSDYDTDTARKFFNDSNYNDKSNENISMLIRDKYGAKNIASFVITNWYKLFKLPVKGKVVTDKTLLESLDNGSFDIILDIYDSTDINSYDFFDYIANIYSINYNNNSMNVDELKNYASSFEKSLQSNATLGTIYKNSYVMKINSKIKFISSNLYGITYIREIQ